MASETSHPAVPRTFFRPAAWRLLPWALAAAAAAAAATLGLAPAVLVGGVMLVATMLALAGEALLFLWILVAVSGVGFGWAEGSVMGFGGNTINLSGLRWGLIVVASGALLLRTRDVRVPRLLLPYLAFLGLAAVAVLWAPSRFEGIKNLLQFAAPLLVALVALAAVRSRADVDHLRIAFWIGLGLGVAAMVSVAVVAPALGLEVPPGAVLSHRGFTMWLLPAYALALAAWRVRGGGWLWAAAALFVLALVTLARTSIGAMLLMALVTLLVRPARLRPLPLLLLVLAGFGALQYGPLRARLFADPRVGFDERLITITGTGEDAQLSIAGLNMTGRGMVWIRTLTHAAERPVLGHGTGSATHYLGAELGLSIVHPHNDYLRVLHDQGVVGLALIALFAVAAALALRRRWHEATSAHARELALAGLLALVAYLAVAVFDNSMLYVTFFTQNIFLLLALAVRAQELDAPAA